MSTLQSYKQLIVWQKSMLLVELIYKVTETFPRSELYGLVSQIRRAAVSIPSNIAEGYGRVSPRDYGQFYSISYGSLLELETQIELAHRLGFIDEQSLLKIASLTEEVSKMLHTMIIKTRKLGPKSLYN